MSFGPEIDEIMETAQRAEDIANKLIDIALEVADPEFSLKYKTELPKLGFSDEGWNLIGERKRRIGVLQAMGRFPLYNEIEDSSYEFCRLSGDELQKGIEDYRKNLASLQSRN